VETHNDNDLDEDNIDWTFRTANVKEHVHSFHAYPARMVPQVVEHLIKIFSTKVIDSIGHQNWSIYDPFCGSGTVLVEGKKLKFNVCGVDINPLAVLIANVKATPIEKKGLTEIWTILKNNYHIMWKNKEYKQIPDPEIPRLAFWFKKSVVNQLKVIQKSIWDLEQTDADPNVINFFKVCFSITVRKGSNNRQGEFKLYRLKKDDLIKWSPNIFEIFENKVNDGIKQMELFYPLANNTKIARAIVSDSRLFKPSTSVGLIITSPPYGDHKTTVAYGQFSRYPGYWLKFETEQIQQIDNNGLGGKPKKIDISAADFSKYGSPTLIKIIEQVHKGDREASNMKLQREIETATTECRSPNYKVKSNPRVFHFISFFDDFFVVLKKLYIILISGGYACFVTGNRTVRGNRIPTHEITKELCVTAGFKHYKTLKRSIPTKTMPWENAPSNISGEKGETMATEHIVIVYKDS